MSDREFITITVTIGVFVLMVAISLLWVFNSSGPDTETGNGLDGQAEVVAGRHAVPLAMQEAAKRQDALDRREEFRGGVVAVGVSLLVLLGLSGRLQKCCMTIGRRIVGWVFISRPGV